MSPPSAAAASRANGRALAPPTPFRRLRGPRRNGPRRSTPGGGSSPNRSVVVANWPRLTGNRRTRWRTRSDKRGERFSTRASFCGRAAGWTLLAAMTGRCYQPRNACKRKKSGPRMAEKRKDSKLKARLPRGFEDRGPIEIAATRRMVETIRQVYERYGFEPVETPAVEYTDALGKFLPDQDRPNEGVFSFQDDDEQWLSLRYDLTAPLARYVAENFDTLP